MPEGAGSGNWLGIDFGKRKLGLAVAHPLTGSARPLETLRYSEVTQLEAGLLRVIKEWRPAIIVVGLPLDGEGRDTDMSRRVRAFIERLASLAPMAEIRLHDERLTSHAAAGAFAERREQGRARRRDAAHLDSLAAALILDSWIAEHDHA